MNKKLLSILLVVVLLLGLTACSQEEKKVVLASKPFTEQYVLAEMLIALIEQDTDITVDYKEGISGGHANIHPAMLNGEIDLYPEYTGTGWLQVLKQDLINDPMELYNEVKAAYAEEFDIVWSELYGFNDTFAIAMKEDLANEMGIKTYSDLAAKGGDLRFGSEHDFYEREDGFIGLEKVYGFAFADQVGMDIGLKYTAINNGEVDVINVFSTDGKLAESEMIVLDDDQNFFPSYFCATLIRQETLDKYPELEDVLAKLDGQISNEEMTYMNYLVDVEKNEVKTVATDFLKEKGLLD